MIGLSEESEEPEESEESELEEIQKRREASLRGRIAERQKRSELDAQKQAVLRVVLTPEARQRLTNLKLVKPDFAERIELQLLQIVQTGKVQLPITDQQLKEILIKLQSSRRDITIRRR